MRALLHGDRQATACIPLLLLVLLAGGSAYSKPVSATGFNGFAVDNALIDPAQIHQGGPPRDGIPAIDNPRFVAASDADLLRPDNRVIGVHLNGEARAYPILILNWHEVVNDRIGGIPVVVTYCPLCGTGVVYRAEVQGTRLSFGVSGLLYNSDVLLYDRQTESLWSQLLNRAVSGPRKGQALEMLAAEHTSWAQWRERFPETRVLSTDTGYRRDYQRNPYGGYEESPALYFPVAFLNRRYHPKERVLGVVLNGQYKAYPFAELARRGPQGALEDHLAGRPVRIEYDAELRTGRVLSESGEQLPAVNAYWFAWYAFHPETAVYEYQSP